MKKYMKYVRKYIILQIVFYFLYVLTTAIVPYLQKLLFDKAKVYGLKFVLFLVGAYIVVIAISEVTSYISERYVWRTAIEFENKLKRDFFSVISKMENNEFSKKSVGEYISLQGNDITTLEQDYLTPALDIVKSILMVIIYSVVIFIMIDYKIGIVLLIQSIVVVFVPKIMAGKLSDSRNKYLRQMGKYVELVKELYENHAILSVRTRDAVVKHHDSELNKTSGMRMNYGRRKCLSLSLSGGAINIVHIIIFGIIGYLFIKGNITLGTATSALAYVECFVGPLESFLYDIDAINSTKNIREKVCAYLEGHNEDKKTLLYNFKEEITCNNIVVNYKDFSLKDFSFSFKKGKKYAIIGHSGSGKSTIIKAIMQKINVDKGQILIDGLDVKNYDKSNIVGYFGQKDIIFSDNFENNVSLFGAYDINLLPDNIRNRSSVRKIENCNLLSGGEKKIIGFLRLYVENADICILDEPFAGVDYKMTRNITSKIMDSNKTVIMVTHDIEEEYLRQFDEILFIKQGRLIASGDYETIQEYV